MSFFRALIVLFAVASLLFFCGSSGFLAWGIATSGGKDIPHKIYGYTIAIIQVFVIAGWIWAFCVTRKSELALSKPVQAMCVATAAAQFAIALATVALVGRWLPGGRLNFYFYHAVLGAVCALAITLIRRRKSVSPE